MHAMSIDLFSPSSKEIFFKFYFVERATRLFCRIKSKFLRVHIEVMLQTYSNMMHTRNFLGGDVESMKNALDKNIFPHLSNIRMNDLLAFNTTIANTIWFRPEKCFSVEVLCVRPILRWRGEEGGRRFINVYVCVWKEREMYWFDFEVNQLRSSYIHPHSPLRTLSYTYVCMKYSINHQEILLWLILFLKKKLILFWLTSSFFFRQKLHIDHHNINKSSTNYVLQ